MSEAIEVHLARSDRRMLEALAAAAGVELAAITGAAVEQYLRLLRDAPAVLPPDPMKSLSATARKGVK